MENNGRKLKVLVIHDTNFTHDAAAILGSSQLEVCYLTIQTRDDLVVRMPQLLSWKDTLNLLQTWCGDGLGTEVRVDEPDILLIDCHFDDDRSAPSLIPVANGKTIDARGLLYGLVLAAYFVGRRPDKPFGFAVYSQDLAAAADDAYAVTMFGLLEALAGASTSKRPTAAVFKAKMIQTRGGKDPALVLPRALESFRNSLLRSFNYRVQPEIGAFQEARNAVARIVSGQAEVGDVSLSWVTADGKRENVLLKSLFAECVDGEMRWIPKLLAKRHVTEYLDSVLNDHNPEEQLLKPVIKIVDAVERHERSDVPWSVGMKGYRQKLLALLLLWARDRTAVSAARRRKENPIAKSIGDLDEMLDVTPREMNRALGRVLGNYDTSRSEGEPLYPGKDLLEKLDGSSDWPLPDIGWIREIIRRDLARRKVTATREHPLESWRFDEVHWPRCLLTVGHVP